MMRDILTKAYGPHKGMAAKLTVPTLRRCSCRDHTLVKYQVMSHLTEIQRWAKDVGYVCFMQT